MNFISSNKKICPEIKSDVTICVICLSPLISKRSIHLECLHEFHIDCLHDWFRLKSSCPCCRTKQKNAVLLLRYLKRNRSNVQLLSEFVSRFILRKKYVY